MADECQNDDLRWLEQVASLGDAQQPLVAGLKVLADELREGPLKKRLALFAKRLDAGVPLKTALEVSDDFPSYVRSAILIGLKTGRLGSVIEEIAWQQRANRSAIRSVWAALAYPLMVLGLLVVVTQLLFVWLVPVFVDVYDEFQMDLPVITLWFIRLKRIVGCKSVDMLF
ncbi:MAG: type II secretion system F family protein, partial [Pirellulales bacterium]